MHFQQIEHANIYSLSKFKELEKVQPAFVMAPPPTQDPEERKSQENVQDGARMQAYQISAKTSFLIVTRHLVYLLRFDPTTGENGGIRCDKVQAACQLANNESIFVS